MAEGAPLLREYRVYSSIEGSNPSVSATLRAYALRVASHPIALATQEWLPKLAKQAQGCLFPLGPKYVVCLFSRTQ